MKQAWQWFIENWDTIRLVLLVVAGIVSYIFVKLKGDLKQFATLVWAAALELSKEGIDSVDRPVIDALVDPIYDILVVSKIGPLLRLFLTKERLQDAAWTFWVSFKDSLSGGAGSVPEWNMYFTSVYRARNTLAKQGKMRPTRSRPFK